MIADPICGSPADTIDELRDDDAAPRSLPAREGRREAPRRRFVPRCSPGGDQGNKHGEPAPATLRRRFARSLRAGRTSAQASRKACARAKCGRGRCTTSPTPATPRSSSLRCSTPISSPRSRGTRRGRRFAWTCALAASYIAIMLTAPLIGAYADAHAAKKKLLLATTVGCVVFTAALALVGPGDALARRRARHAFQLLLRHRRESRRGFPARDRAR